MTTWSCSRSQDLQSSREQPFRMSLGACEGFRKLGSSVGCGILPILTDGSRYGWSTRRSFTEALDMIISVLWTILKLLWMADMRTRSLIVTIQDQQSQEDIFHGCRESSILMKRNRKEMRISSDRRDQQADLGS